jgi:hypothetical protein
MDEIIDVVHNIEKVRYVHNGESIIDLGNIRGQVGKKHWNVAYQSDSGERITLLESNVEDLKADVEDLKATNKDLLAANKRQLANSRNYAARTAIQDLNSSFELQIFFKSQNDLVTSKKLVAMKNVRVRGSHFLLIDPNSSKPLNLNAISHNSDFDSPSIVCYKVSLLKTFICSLPNDIESALGSTLIDGLKVFVNTKLTDDVLKLKDSISVEEMSEVTECIEEFFQDVPEFPRH